jgi:hypothetical protein
MIENHSGERVDPHPYHYVTFSGIPLRLELHWPFHLSTSGADWHVMTAMAHLADGGPLHAELAVSLSQTMKEALPSIEQEWAEPLVINSIRKTVDLGELAFLKSGKKQPVHVSSRYYSFLTRKIQFMTQPDADITEMLKRRVYWLGAHGGRDEAVWIADPVDAQYAGVEAEKLTALARQLGSQGLLTLDGEMARATDKLRAEAEKMAAVKDAWVKQGTMAVKLSAS